MQPPASLKALGDPIYEAFYGLSEQPFAITTDPRFFYLSAAHQRAFSELLNGLKRRESMILLTGETGSGKTTLCRAVLEALGDRTFSAIVLNPYMSGAEVLRIVMRDFGFVSHEDLRRSALAAADVPQLLDALEGFLKSLLPIAGYAVIVIDEAQSLSTTVLDQIRMLTALEHDHRRLVQVVLCGQPSLAATIKSEPLQALNERITRRIELVPLTPDDVTGYIKHRLGVAGAGEAVEFAPEAMLAIAELSRGLPRRVNVLCDRSLQEGRIEGVNLITLDLVKRAARALAGVHDPMPAGVAVPPPAPAPASPAVPVPEAPPEAASVPESPGVSAAAATPSATPAEDEVNPFAELPSLSFGQKAEEAPSRWRMVGYAAGAVIAALASAYAAWVWTAGTPASVVPPAPTTKVLSGGAPAVAIPVPSPAELELMMAAPVIRRFPTPEAAAPVEGAPAPAPSAQNPENSN